MKKKILLFFSVLAGLFLMCPGASFAADFFTTDSWNARLTIGLSLIPQ